MPPPLLSLKFFPYQSFSETDWFLGEVFSVLLVRKIFDKTVKLPLLCFKNSIPEIFRNTEVFSYEFYRNCETKSFRRRNVILPPLCLSLSLLLSLSLSLSLSTSPSPMHKIFRYPKFSDTPKCSQTTFFGTV